MLEENDEDDNTETIMIIYVDYRNDGENEDVYFYEDGEDWLFSKGWNSLKSFSALISIIITCFVIG